MADTDWQTGAKEFESIRKVNELSYYGHNNAAVRIPDCESSRNLNYQEYMSRICHRNACTCVIVTAL